MLSTLPSGFEEILNTPEYKPGPADLDLAEGILARCESEGVDVKDIIHEAILYLTQTGRLSSACSTRAGPMLSASGVLYFISDKFHIQADQVKKRGFARGQNPDPSHLRFPASAYDLPDQQKPDQGGSQD